MNLGDGRKLVCPGFGNQELAIPLVEAIRGLPPNFKVPPRPILLAVRIASMHTSYTH